VNGLILDGVEKAFDTIAKNRDLIRTYEDYWSSIAPVSEFEEFKRLVFAFLSVHTSYQGNIRAYQALDKDTSWINDHTRLVELLEYSRIGLHNQKAKNIWLSIDQFFSQTKQISKLSTDSCNRVWRDRVARTLRGLSYAKSSFYIEMVEPLDPGVVCFDVHMLRLYGLDSDQGKNKDTYYKLEDDWISRSKNIGISPYIARCIYWDSIQKEKDSRYWSFVFETSKHWELTCKSQHILQYA